MLPPVDSSARRAVTEAVAVGQHVRHLFSGYGWHTGTIYIHSSTHYFVCRDFASYSLGVV